MGMEEKIISVTSRKEINDKLTDIYQRIGSEDTGKLHQEMDRIFMYKPVDNYYTFVRASIYMQENDLDMVRQTINGRENWYFPGPYAVLLAQLQYETEAKALHPFEAKMQKILAYYVYVALIEGKSEDRDIFIDEQFVEEAKKCYEAELLCEKELVSYGKSDWENESGERQADYLGRLFAVEYNLSNYFLCTLCLYVRDQLKRPDNSFYDFYRKYVVESEPNIGFLGQELGSESTDEFIVITDDYLNKTYTDLVEKLLKQLGKACHIVCKRNEDGKWLVGQLENFLEKKAYYTLIASRFTMIQLRQNGMGKKVECLSEYRGKIHLDAICFGYVGDYTEYISRIYQYDFAGEMAKEDECLFSVVIPARNSAYTLQYTLQTILQQQNIEKEEYEIIVSDNSSSGNIAVRELIEKMDDPQIRYCKTPVDLPLHKSFEFAYGKARGRYIIPLGSDDGMLPWAFETLKKITLKYGRENVICWERGFFQWSESNSPQKGKLVIPRNYKKGDYQETLTDGLEALREQIAENGKLIYGRPLYYINTAFKRSYLKEMLDKTGKILDGYTQDVNMAIKGMILNKQFLSVCYPLTIAGMADGSLGARMGADVVTSRELIENVKNETPRGYGFTPLKSEMPFLVVDSTEGLFWAELFRDYAEECYRDKLNQIMQGHDFKDTFILLTGSRGRNSLDYVMSLEKLRYNAWCLSDELGQWCDRVLYPAATQKLYWTGNEKESVEMDFQAGFGENGGLTLDARQFDVRDIKEAVNLFQRIVNL